MPKFKKTHETQIIADDNGIEVLVSFYYERQSAQIEEGHGFHDVGSCYDIDLLSVQVVIAGVGVDILRSLNKKQRNKITDLINMEEVAYA